MILPESIEGVLDPGALVPLDRADIVEIVDDIDSFESLLLSSCSEAFLGGRAGDGCIDCFLAGSLGGCIGVGFAG